jgi:ABC-type glycerol-3-phosphate transport system substrate-binding protein
MRRVRHPLALALAGGALLGLSFAGCGGSSTSAKSSTVSKNDTGGAITVWMDAPRVPGVEAFEKANPGIKVNLVTIPTADSDAQLEQKFVLDDEAKKGWPDVIFFPDNGDIAWASNSSINYTADLDNLVSSQVKSGYDAATIGPCEIGGELRCLRNDTAPDVLWYNTKLFNEWGYQPPTTWQQYMTLALKIAKAHPGYVSGLLGDGYAVGRYLWASGCPVSQTAGVLKAHINLKDPRCTRVQSMLQTLLAAKAVTPDGIFDSSAAALSSHIVMTPGAVWYGDYLFRDTFKIPAGEMTAAPSLYWAGDKTRITGDEGGGLYGLSSHIKGKELANAVTFAEWMVQAPAWQVDLSTGLPAYGPDRQLWLDKQNADGFFADYPSMEKAILAAPALVGTNYQYQQYDPTQVWVSTMVPVIANHGSFDSGWSAFSSQVVDKAKSVGYQVISS